MRVIIEKDPAVASQIAAERIASLVFRKPDCVLGLATGSTPLQTYRLLINKHRNEGLDFSRVTTFNLDEYVGLAPSHEQSYRSFMNESLFSQINIRMTNTFVPDGLSSDFVASCAKYEQQIKDLGGIDLQLLGIGSDGHIAFNEPGSSLASRTRVKTLDCETIHDNARFFGSENEVPTMAVTMGVGTILDAKQCVLIATGSHKANAIQQMVEGPVTSQVTASALQMHPNSITIVDEAAASQLNRRDYYRRSEEAQRAMESRHVETFGHSAIPHLFNSKTEAQTGKTLT